MLGLLPGSNETNACLTGPAGVNQSVPLSVSSRLEEDSALNYMPCYMPHPASVQQSPQPSLVARDWDAPASRDKCQHQLSSPVTAAGSAGGKMTAAAVDLAAGVKKQSPASSPQTDMADNHTQTG